MNAIFSSISNEKILHVSHNDMDGFYCNFVCDKSFAANITHINTKRINDVIETTRNGVSKVIDELTAANAADLKFTVLITDIGSIDIKELQEALSEYSDHIANIYIVDHHKTTYTGEAFMVTDRYTEKIHRFYKVIDNSSISTTFVYTTEEISACLMLYYLTADNRYADQFLYELSKLVSKYDTGHWGNWAVEFPDLEVLMNNDIYIRIELAKAIVCNLLNPETVTANNFYSDDAFNDFVYDGVRYMADKWMSRCMTRKRSGKYQTFVDLMKGEFRVTRYVYEYNRKLISDYEMFKSKLIEITPDDMIDPNTVRIMVNDSEYIKLRLPDNTNITKIRIIKNTDDFRFYNFSLFSKDYVEKVENETDCIIQVTHKPFMKGECKKLIIGIRSNDDYSSYSLAAANGGGGHFRAAGCQCTVYELETC